MTTLTTARYHQSSNGAWSPCDASDESSCPYGVALPGGLGHVDQTTAVRLNERRSELAAFEEEVAAQFGPDAMQQIMRPTNNAPLPVPTGEAPYQVLNYLPMTARIQAKPVTTQTQLDHAVQNTTGARGKDTIRHVIIDMNNKQLFPKHNTKIEINGPSDGRPIIVDYKHGYTSIAVASGTALINATSTYGGGVEIKNDAAATIITPPGKFNIDVRDNAKVIVVPRPGARGGVWVKDNADATIQDIPGVTHNITIHRQPRNI